MTEKGQTTEKIKVKTQEPEPKGRKDALERELEDSFPASDPPSLTQELTPGDPERKPGKSR